MKNFGRMLNRGSNAKENSRETNHRIGCDLCFVAGSFVAGAGSARTAETRTRGEAARIFCGQLERRGQIYCARYDRPGVINSKVGMGVWRIFYCGSFGQQIARGDFKIMAVLGYDSETKTYTYNAFDSWGELTTAKGNVSGDTWTWTTETMMEGKSIKTRLTEKEVSKTQYTLKYESSTDGGNTWTSDLESTFTKVTAAAPAAK